jgi:hypothetical protein
MSKRDFCSGIGEWVTGCFRGECAVLWVDMNQFQSVGQLQESFICT